MSVIFSSELVCARSDESKAALFARVRRDHRDSHRHLIGGVPKTFLLRSFRYQYRRDRIRRKCFINTETEGVCQ